MNGPLAAYEGHYTSVIPSHFRMLGFKPVGEDGGSRNRTDMAVRFNGRVHLFELKVVEHWPEEAVLVQLKARNYADKYRDLSHPPT